MTQAELKAALIKAHRAGDTRAAELFAERLRAMPEAGPTGRQVARGALKGALLGFGDEITAAVTAPFAAMATGNPLTEAYRDIRDAERAEQAQFEAAHPGTALATELGGSFLTGGAAAGRLAGTRLGQRLGQRMAAATLPQRAGMAAGLGAAGGAGSGAIAGAGEAPTLADVPAQAATGAATGGLLGLVLGPAAETGITAAQRGANLLLDAASPRRAAERRIARAVERTGRPEAELTARAGAMGPSAVLADVDPAMRGLLESVTQVEGQARTQAERQLRARTKQQSDWLTEPFGPARAIEMTQANKQAREQAAGPLYRQAFAEGVEHTDRLENLLQRPSVQRAWSKAKRRGQDILGPEFDPDRYGTVRPSLEGWQAIKETLDDQLGRLYRQGKNKEAGELKTNVLDPLLNELDAQSPTYANARAVWAGSKAYDDALEEGSRFLLDSSSVTADKLANLTDYEREAYRVGMTQAIHDRLEKMGFTHDSTKIFRTPGMQRKLKAVLSPEEYADFQNRLLALQNQQQTLNQALENSATARRMSQQAESDAADALFGMAQDVVTGMPVQSMAAQGVRGLLERVPTPAKTETARNLIGQVMLEQDPARRALLLQQIRAAQAQQSRGAGLLGPGLGVAAGGAAGLLAQ